MRPERIAVGMAVVLLAACERGPSPDRIAYPEARVSDHVDDYFGVQVPDPYRWLEDLESEETARWVEAENAISFPYLEALPEREDLKERLTELWNYERFDLPRREGGRYFFTRNDGLQNQNILYVADGLDDEPRELIDPNGFREDGTEAMSGYSVSPDGRLIAYARSDAGSDWRTWHLRDVETGADLGDFLEHTKTGFVEWSPDSKGFYYSRHPLGADGTADDRQQVSVYYHTVGTSQSDDPLVFGLPEHPGRNAYASVSDDGRYLLLNVREVYFTNALYYRDLQGDGKVVRLLDDWDAQYDYVGNEGDVFFIRTNRDAPLGRLVAVDLERPSPEDWTEVIPESDAALDGVSYVGGHFVVQLLEDARSVVRVHDRSGTLVREVELPGLGRAQGFGGDPADPETFFSFTSFTDPGGIYRYDVASGEAALWRAPTVSFDPQAYETRQVFYESRDGTRVPMFITHQKGIELDGSNPTVLYGYGGFNIAQTPGFRPARLAWMEMGGVFAVAGIRGGGEYGEAWHQAGARTNRQNVFDDFIAAAEWLIESGYTSTEHLAVQGGSNGGLLVGAVMTQRPELFGAALPAVGVLDMLRYHTASLNARNWSSDYGLSEDEDEFRAQLAYSPVHNVRPGTCYPPTLVTTADHDDRVVPWHSFKFGAALQAAQSCAHPVLVRVETRAGHGGGKPTWMRIEEIADQWAFLWEHIGPR